MPRQIPWGTPARSLRILFPRRERRVLLYSVAAGVAVAAAVAALYAAGARRTVSPGEVARAHHEIDAKCSQCHEEGQNVADVRCARCHDPSAVGRVEHASHVLLGSGDLVKAAAAPEVACATCHTDHRGQEFVMRGVDDRRCASCHRDQFSALLHLAPLTSFQNHPEFSVVKAQQTSGVGLQFNHVTHFGYVVREQRGIDKVDVEESRRVALDTCKRCHIKNAERPQFEPIAFDTTCSGSRCHTDPKGFLKDGTLDVTLKHVARDIPGIATPPGDGDDETQIFSGLTHRDPWVQFNASWLRTALDPGGAGAEREALRASIAWLEQQVGRPKHLCGSIRRRSPEHRGRACRSGRDRQGGRTAAPRGRVAALGTAAGEIQDIITQLRTATGQSAPPPSDGDAAAGLTGRAGAGADPDAGPRFDDRRAELLGLVTTIRDRAIAAGDNELASRADDLRARIEQVQLQPAVERRTSPRSDGLLDGLDEVFKLARQATIRSCAPICSSSRDCANTRDRGGGGVDAAEFERRRQEIARLSDTLSQSPDPAVRQKAADLRGEWRFCSRRSVSRRARQQADDVGGSIARGSRSPCRRREMVRPRRPRRSVQPTPNSASNSSDRCSPCWIGRRLHRHRRAGSRRAANDFQESYDAVFQVPPG